TGAVAGPFTGRGEPEATWLSSALPLNHYTEFARRFSFRETPFHPPNWDSQNLEAILLQCGPLHFSGFAGQFGHAVVVCGIDVSQNVHYGDPASGAIFRAPLVQFSAWKRQFFGFPNPLYYAGH